MKETKVYMSKLPEIYDECPCHSVMEDRCVLLRKQTIEPFLQSCPLKSLKTHDRELVKEVCEKIRNFLLDKCEFDYGYYINDGDFTVPDLWYFLDQIQKEFEK